MYREEKGITLVILIITIIVIMILTGTIAVNVNEYTLAKKVINMDDDVLMLQQSLPIYYEKHQELPISGMLDASQSARFGDQKNANDNDEYGVIDATLLDDLQLTFGYGTRSTEDYYVVNTGSFAVYYLAGIEIDGEMHYTIEQNDSAVNTNVPSSDEFEIEATATATTITVTGEATSDLGIKGYKFRINNENWTELQTSGKYIFSNLASGEKYIVSMQAIDMQENVIMADNNGLEVYTSSSQMTNGMFDISKGVNTPDTSKLPTATTKYITWTEANGTYTEQLADSAPNNWYDYTNGNWANIKSTGNNLEAYWVWIPRFAYKLPENGRVAKQIDVVFVRDKGTTGANGEKCYYSTDIAISNDMSGLYTSATPLAKGTEAGKEQAWIIHPAFWWDNNSNGIMEEDEQLAGIWVAKFEASSSNPSATNGGDNVNTLKVQVKPGVTSWRGINIKNAFEVTRAMQDIGGVIGTVNGITTIDAHVAKNMEWAAVSVLSQSKYGIYNPKSATGLTTNGGDGTLRVWNNPNISYTTGTVGSSADAASVSDGNCVRYNTGNGPKGSTTGTIYGVYDMAGGAQDQVMGIMAKSVTEKTIPANGATGFTTWPDCKYYDIYDYGTSNTEYSRGKVGDLTSELSPIYTNNTTYSWNNDATYFVSSAPTVIAPLLRRGAYQGYGARAGTFAFTRGGDVVDTSASFRPVLITLQPQEEGIEVNN